MAFQELRKFVVLCLFSFATRFVCRQMMRFVEDHEIPGRGFFETLHSCPNFESIDTRNQTVMFGERI